jgi:hypothetical protein
MSGKPGPEAMPVLVSGKWGVVNSEKWVFGNKKGQTNDILFLCPVSMLFRS